MIYAILTVAGILGIIACFLGFLNAVALAKDAREESSTSLLNIYAHFALHALCLAICLAILITILTTIPR